MSGPMQAPLLFESDYLPFAVKADDGTERVYQIIVNRGGTASLVLLTTNPPPARAEAS
jgi:hypothetical protein